MIQAGIIFAILALGLILYWLLVLTEGTYLGTRIVILLYDLSAKRYDKIKGLHYVDEARCIGLPLANILNPIPSSRVLDVATGTGRVPLALVREWGFTGTIVGIDHSRLMLAEAATATANYDGRITLMREDASGLSFIDDSFDCVVCLESLEFMWDSRSVIGEMVRVLKPGGILLLSNRVGKDTRFFPGRLCGRGKLEKYLHQLGLEHVETKRWQVHYDLVGARKVSAKAETDSTKIASRNGNA